MALACVLGRSGIAADKHEGDGATPAAIMPLRRVFYRPDREARPVTGLACYPMRGDFGWCDDPASGAYNRLIRRPFAGGHEILWRDDHLYDLIVELGYNDSPPVRRRGSAIFLHVCKPDRSPTEGCIAMSRIDLRRFLSVARPGDAICVKR